MTLGPGRSRCTSSPPPPRSSVSPRRGPLPGSSSPYPGIHPRETAARAVTEQGNGLCLGQEVLAEREAKARVVARFERSYVEDMLLVHDGNISRAANKDRRTFWELVRKHKIDANPHHPLPLRPHAGLDADAGVDDLRVLLGVHLPLPEVEVDRVGTVARRRGQGRHLRLLLAVAEDAFIDDRPTIYQTVTGADREVVGGALDGADGEAVVARRHPVADEPL